MNNISFFPDAWADYLYWQTQDKRTLKRINALLADIARNGNEGLGKPEALTHELSGWWSRRIDDANRLVYKLDGETVVVARCRFHYGDK